MMMEEVGPLLRDVRLEKKEEKSSSRQRGKKDNVLSVRGRRTLCFVRCFVQKDG